MDRQQLSNHLLDRHHPLIKVVASDREAMRTIMAQQSLAMAHRSLEGLHRPPDLHQVAGK